MPVAWLKAARQAGGSALAVGLMAWHLAGLAGTHEGLRLRPSHYDAFGLSRHAVYRGLAALEWAGLVRVTRAPGAAATVDLLPPPTAKEPEP